MARVLKESQFCLYTPRSSTQLQTHVWQCYVCGY